MAHFERTKDDGRKDKQEKGKQRADPGSPSKGELWHTRFSSSKFGGLRGDLGSVDKFNAMRDALDKITSSTIEGVAGPSTSYSETGATHDLKGKDKNDI